MGEYGQSIIYLTGFLVLTVASFRISQLFVRLKLPVITGLLVIGILIGPYALNLIGREKIQHLSILNDFSLAFIAFAAGSELFLRELRDSFRSIAWNTFGQLGVTFLISSLAIYFLADYLPVLRELSGGSRLAVAILAGTIFVARSPSSAIAIINEMRAKGPFVRTAMGVTVVKDVLVIILFALCFSLGQSLIKEEAFNLTLFLVLGVELLLAFLLGYLLGRLMSFVLASDANTAIKTGVLLAMGLGVYLFTHWFREESAHRLFTELHVEPLLVCIVGSFYVTNYSRYRPEFQQIIHDVGPAIYAIFFTLTGASMSIDILAEVWRVALFLFFIRLVSMMLGAYLGGTMANDPPLHKRVGWMPYVTQAGVGVGLATEVAAEFPTWGPTFYTIIIAVIVINQLVGPPLFKLSINLVGEAHGRAATPVFDGIRDVIIFGLENQSLALARKLKESNWMVKIAALESKTEEDWNNPPDLDVQPVKNISLESLRELKADRADAIVLMMSDEENYRLCELIYEKVGTKDLIVRLNDRSNFERFHELGAIIVDPSTAIVSLLDHCVRSPNATSLLLGYVEGQDTIDLEVMDPRLNGILLRELRLPSDVIVLSVRRNDNLIISHGYTKLLLGDVVTVVGSEESLRQISLRFNA